MNLASRHDSHFWLKRLVLLGALIVCGDKGQAQNFKVTLLGTGYPEPQMDRFGPSTLVKAGSDAIAPSHPHQVRSECLLPAQTNGQPHTPNTSRFGRHAWPLDALEKVAGAIRAVRYTAEEQQALPIH